MEERIRLLSYNICHGAGLDDVVDVARDAEVIKATGADFVALQEVDCKVPRSNMLDEMAVLGRLTGMHGFFAKAIDLDGGAYGVGILSRMPAKIVCHKPLPGLEKRTILGVSTVSPKSKIPFRFYCTHFDLDSDLQYESAGILLDEIKGFDGPSVVMGDFNCQLTDAPWKRLAAELKCATASRKYYTFSSVEDKLAIDHCFFSGVNWKYSRAVPLNVPNISDHRPLRVTVSLNK